jgi:hypothetical protein
MIVLFRRLGSTVRAGLLCWDHIPLSSCKNYLGSDCVCWSNKILVILKLDLFFNYDES